MAQPDNTQQTEALLQSILIKQNQILAKLNALSEREDVERGDASPVPRKDSATFQNGTERGDASPVPRKDSATFQNGTEEPSPCSTMLDVFFEREFYRDFETGDDFRERFLRLVKGLDAESVATVVRCLRRVQKIRGCSDRFLSLYTAEEQAEYRQMKEHFSREILRLSADCCFYDGWMLPNGAFEPSVFIDQCGFRHLRHPERTAGKAVIDAGAYIGDSALLFSRLTDGVIHAFEPSSDNYALMLKTLALNGIEDRVVPRKMALGAQPGAISLNRSVVPSATTQVRKTTVPYVGVETAPVIPLDDYVREHRLKVGLIKIDVEGAEQPLLRGAMETIRTMRPALLVSIYHNAGDFFDIKPMLEEMDLGYRFRVRHPAIGTVMTETMLIAEAD